jgi:hypothetical protein
VVVAPYPTAVEADGGELDRDVFGGRGSVFVEVFADTPVAEAAEGAA